MSFEVATETIKSRKYLNLYYRRMKLGKKFWPFDSDDEKKSEIQALSIKMIDDDKAKEA
jgi:hypothetical protein